jgi:hypothetical protein
MLLSIKGIELGWVPLRNSPSSSTLGALVDPSSSTLGALVETKLALAGDNDRRSVGGMIEMWSKGFDDGKADGAGDGLEVPFKDT